MQHKGLCKAQVEKVGGILSRKEGKVGNGVNDNLEELFHESEEYSSLGGKV